MASTSSSSSTIGETGVTSVTIKTLDSNQDEYYDKLVQVSGWIKHFRTNPKIAFLSIHDGSTVSLLQVVMEKTKYPVPSETKVGCSCVIEGKFVKSPAKGQKYELLGSSIIILGDVYDPETYIFNSKTNIELEKLREIPHMRIRSKLLYSVTRIKSALRFGMASFFEQNGYPEVQVPVLTENECESGANPFIVTTLEPTEQHTDYSTDFFGKKVCMTVSGQLHLEGLVLDGLGKAWTMTTCGRAEPSHTPLHMAEFWMAEMEMSFVTLEELMDVNERCIKSTISYVVDKCLSEITLLEERSGKQLYEKLVKYINTPFGKVTHHMAVKQMLLALENGSVTINPDKTPSCPINVFKELPTYDGDLSKDHEKWICSVLFDNIPTFITHYPAQIKAFYMPKVDHYEDSVERVDNFDCVFPDIGEVIGGSIRIDNTDELVNKMQQMGVNQEPLQWYVDLRKYGSCPHGGSGIGIDRLMLVITGLTNVRDVVPYPRTYEVCKF